MKSINKIFFLGLLLTTSQLLFATQIDWVDWTSGTTNEVIGQGTSKEIIDVTYNGSYVGVQTDGGTNYWIPSIPYTNNAVVDYEPPASDIIRITGGENAISHSITFSKMVTNPVMAIVSLGQPSISVSYEFDAPFNILSQGEGFWGNGTLTELDNNVLKGQEGHGVIQFIGTFTSISWTVSNSENWHGFTIGMPTNAENECLDPNRGTVSSSLDIHMPSLNYQSLLGIQNIWADLEYLGTNSEGKHIWGLKDFGVNDSTTMH